MRRLAIIFISYTLAAVIAGCASSPSRFYTLSPMGAPAVQPSSNFTVSVGPVSVPDVVNRLPIVLRTGPNQVFISEFDRWASPLKENIARVVAENLVSMLGTPHVTIFPQSSAAEASYRVMINILRFDSELGKAATLDAILTVNSAKEGQPHRSRKTLTEPTQGDDYAALVAAHSRALGQMSAEIAGMIREIEAQKR
ncbi:MAG: PqiC family protein [Syntrophaceae bacterium]